MEYFQIVAAAYRQIIDPSSHARLGFRQESWTPLGRAFLRNLVIGLLSGYFIGAFLPCICTVFRTAWYQDHPNPYPPLQADVTGQQHRLEDYDPRRVFTLVFTVRISFYELLEACSFTVSILNNILTISYWYTRSSTVGLSTLDIQLVSLATIYYSLFNLFIVLMLDSELLPPFQIFTAGLVLISLFHLGNLYMLNAAVQPKMYWYRGWIPGVRFFPSTQQERMSKGIDLRTSLRNGMMTCGVLAGAFFIHHYQNAAVLKPENTWILVSNHLLRRLNAFEMLTVPLPALITGWILLIILNLRTTRFVGMFALGAYVSVLSILFRFAFDPKDNLSYIKFSLGLCYAVLVGQALRYGEISDDDDDDTDEDTRY